MEQRMTDRIAYVAGAWVPLAEAKVSVTDRGFLFGDGVYEVAAVLDGKLVEREPHLARLERSCREIRLALPVPRDAISALMDEIVARNHLVEGAVYLQITRGVAERDFAMPKAAVPTLVMFTQERSILASPAAERGVAIVTVPDIRWQRRDIKSISLLAQVLARQAAVDAGCSEAWMIEEGTITEGAASTAFIIDASGTLLTRPLGNDILHGTTRETILALAREHGIPVDERAFTLAEAKAAREAFYTGASSFVIPVIAIDGQKLGDGTPGPSTRRLRELYVARVRG
jgi:D-alanine transaminase